MNNIQTTTVCPLSYSDMRTYILSAAFVAGNIVLPQLCHLVPGGGLILLPIYFFTLVAAYRFGVWAGLLTAVMSPIANNLLFGMPPSSMIAVILVKSVLLALASALAAMRAGRVTLLAVASAVVAYQAVGTVAEWGLTGSLSVALQDLRIGWPGLLVQVFGGWFVLRQLAVRRP